MKVIKRIPFDVNRMSEGKVVDRQGRPVRIIATDRKDSGNKYPVVALCPWGKDGAETIETFTIDGYYTQSGKDRGSNPHLFIEIEEEVEPKFEPFQKVLVRNNDRQMWSTQFFSYKDLSSAYPYVCVCCAYKCCIPYKGNEDLVGTTNSPK